jgi:hypothetical protein
MEAGFSKIKITPSIGTTMTGFIARDRERGSEGVHDDIYVRALYLSHEEEEVLIMGFDLCFFSRGEVDRFKGAIGRKIDLAPRQILLNTSHNHVGPKVGTWQYDPPSDPVYLQAVEYAIVDAAFQARDSMVEVTLWAGATRSSVPMSRRLRLDDGTVGARPWRPSPDGEVCDALPVCLLKTPAGEPLCLLFSVSCHPSTVHGFEISADYPGVAMDHIDHFLGTTASLFLQGAGGDAKAGAIASGDVSWRRGTWNDVEEVGTTVADEVIQVLSGSLTQVEPDLRACTVDMEWPMQPNIGRAGYEALLADPDTDHTRRLWAAEKLDWLDRGYSLPTAIPITAHGVKLGDGLRLIGLEGEAVAGLGLQILAFYEDGVTFPLGYTDGAQLYLHTSPMLDEGGYEVVSSHEYRHPAPLAEGMEAVLDDAMKTLRDNGVD